MSYIPPHFQARIRETKQKQGSELDLSNDYYSRYAGKLTEIPTEIFELQQLESLNLSWNRITEIPEQIAQLHNLKSLNLMGNRLTEIPELIANLPNLIFLGFSWKPSKKITYLD